MKRIKYTWTLLMALAFSISSCNKEDDGTGIATQNIKIGALLSLTGNWSSLGITSKAAIEIALEDINAYMTKSGSRNRFSSIIYDTKLDTALAVKYIAEADQQGCQFVLGPQSSAEAASVKDYADANNILVVSQGSTAGSLSFENDNLFRFCPDDHIEGLAMAKTIYKDGIRALITAARDDAGNKGLQLSTGNAFKALNGNIAATTPYSPALSDFTPLITDIKIRIKQLQSAHDTKEIGIYLASFDECVALFRQAVNDPVLLSVRWYGGDGTALSAALIADTDAALFAMMTNYFAPTFGLPAQAASKWQPLSEEIKKRTGITPDAFALAAYDALWVTAITYNAFPYTKPEFTKLKSEFLEQANRYYGTTGTTMLNAAGDRAVGSYDYWGIKEGVNGFQWTLVGKSE